MLRTVDQEKLKVQFGIVGQTFGLQSNPNLLTYDAISELESGDASRRQDAIKMLGFHIRATALGLVLGYITIGPNPYQGDVPQYDAVGASLSAFPQRYVFNNADLAVIFDNLQTRPPRAGLPC